MEFSSEKDTSNERADKYEQTNKKKSSMSQNKEQNNEIIIEKIYRMNLDIDIVKYIKTDFLGEGGYAKCYKFIKMENGKSFAGKVIPKSSLKEPKKENRLIEEIMIHKKMHHPNIVKFEHFFEDGNNVYILLELCENKTMDDLLKTRKNLTELEVQYYVFNLIKALQYIHSKRIIHRDLKIGNIFLTKTMELKLGDFGLSTELNYERQKKKSLCGTPNYIAPEIINEKAYSYEVDIWSLGIIIYTLIIGKPPFDSSDEKKIYEKIKSLQYSFPESYNVSKEAKDLIKQILVLDPSKRPNLEQILNHTFFKLDKGIPKFLPSSILYNKPDYDYIYEYVSKADIILSEETKGDNYLENDEEDEEYEESNKFNNYNNEKMKNIKIPIIWVKEYVDKSSKYGLGYELTNGNFGAFFNDLTKMILNPETNRLYYISLNKDETEECNKYYLYDYPKELENKVIILIRFKNYLQEKTHDNYLKISQKIENWENIKEKIKEENGKNKIEDEINEKSLIYVISWMRNRHSIVFRFNKRIIQYLFADNSLIILSNETGTATYINKIREILLCPLKIDLTYSNIEMNTRLEYIKQLMNLVKEKLSDRYGILDIFDGKYKNFSINKNDKDKNKNEDNKQQIENEKDEGDKKEEKKSEKECYKK